MDKIYLVTEEQSNWHWTGEQSIESINTVPIRAFEQEAQAIEYKNRNNSTLMNVVEIPFGLPV